MAAVGSLIRPWISDEHTNIDDETSIEPGARVHDHARLFKCTVGRWTLVGPGATICFSTIGRFCSVAWNCSIGATQHPLDRATTHEFPIEPIFGFHRGTSWLESHTEVIVKNDVWIGCHSVLLPGVVVGNGAVVGAGAIVTKDVASYTIVAGAPAQVIRRRFDERTATRLEALAWWDWPASRLATTLDLFRKPMSESVLRGLEHAARPTT